MTGCANHVRLADSVLKKDTQGTRDWWRSSVGNLTGLPMVVSSQQEAEQRLALAEETRDERGCTPGSIRSLSWSVWGRCFGHVNTAPSEKELLEYTHSLKGSCGGAIYPF